MISFRINKNKIKELIVAFSKQNNLQNYLEDQLVMLIDEAEYEDYEEIEKKEREKEELLNIKLNNLKKKESLNKENNIYLKDDSENKTRQRSRTIFTKENLNFSGLEKKENCGIEVTQKISKNRSMSFSDELNNIDKEKNKGKIFLF